MLYPRNDVGVGLTLRAGILPEHASRPVAMPGDTQSSAVYVQASADASAVLTDATQGRFEQYRHFLDEYTLGVRGKLMGLALGASLTWQRILFREPLGFYPSLEPIESDYHRYGRLSVEFTY